MPVLDHDPFEGLVAEELPDLRLPVHLDVRLALELVGEVARHALRQVVAADQEVDRAAPLGEEDGGLPSGISSAHDDRRLATDLCLHLRGGVVDADPLEVRESRHRKPAVASTGRDQNRPSEELGSVIEAQRVVAVSLCQVDRLDRDLDPAPNLSAWIAARAASSLPEIPAGKPK